MPLGLDQKVGALGWSLTADQIKRLDAASDIPVAGPHFNRCFFKERNPAPA
jgi:hypothetical protein